METETPSETAQNAAERPASTPGRTLDPLSSWRRHARRMPWAFALIMVVGVPIAWKMGKPGYYTEAALRVSPSYVANLQDDADIQIASSTQYMQFVQQQISTIRSYDVAMATLTALGERRSLWKKDDESDRKAAERLMAALDVKAVRETYLITIGLPGNSPDGLADIVNALATAYVHSSIDEGLFGADQRVRNLTDRRTEIQKQIDSSVARLTALAGELGVSTFEDTALNPLDSRLIATSESLSEWRRKRIAAESKVGALEDAQHREAALELNSAALDRLERNPAVSSATKLYYDRRDALLAQAQGLAPSHPGYAPIHKQLDDLDAELRRVVDGELATTKDLLAQQRDTAAASELSRARMEFEEARSVEEKLSQDQEVEQGRLTEYATKYQAAMDLTSDIRRARKRVEAIGNRIDSFQLEAVAPGFVRVVADARVPEVPSTGGRRKLFALVLLAAFGVTAVLPILLDRFDPRVVLPADVEKALGIAPMAWIVERTGDRTAAVARDQVRRLGLRLARERAASKSSGALRVALTSVRGGGGASTLALELGAELTTIGLRSIVIEAEPGGSDVRFAGASATLIDVLEDLHRMEHAIAQGDAGRPDRIALGDARDGRLLSHSGVLATVLARLAQRYEVILLDAPPITNAAESEMLVQLADVALLVVAANSVTPRETKAAAAALEKAAPAAVGIVVNRVRAHQHVRALAPSLPPDGEAERRNPEIAVQRWLWA